MGHGGRRAGAGRKPGSKDRATVEQRAALEELARSHTKTAIDAIVAVASDQAQGAARVSAANALLDRGYGKPFQSHEVTGKDGEAIQVNGGVSGLAAAILAILKDAKVQ